MIAAALSAAGYRTGLFTSPHLERIEQRMTIDGQPCEAEEFAALVDLLRPAVEALDRRAAQGQSGPTFFEITTAMALLHFQRQKVQAAVLEVGLGGRLDATNVCQPAVSVITSISFDHTQQLGNTLAAIAGEKAGIIKPGVPVVSGVVEPEARDVIRQVCRERGCRLVERDTDFAFDYHPPRHLEREAASGQVVYRQAAAGAARSLRDLRRVAGPEAHGPPRRSLSTLPCPAGTRRPTPPRHWPRWTSCGRRIGTFPRRPSNGPWPAYRGRPGCKSYREGLRSCWTPPTTSPPIQALVETLEESFSAARRLLIFATTHDKDVRGMLQCLLGHFDEVYFTRYSNNSRAVPPGELQQVAEELTGRRWPALDEPAAAWKAARQIGHGE